MRISRTQLLYRHYRANGGLLPFEAWLKHHQQEQKQIAQSGRNLPGGYAVALGVLVVVCVLVTVAAWAVFKAKGWL